VFDSGTTSSQIIALYEFDKQLRALVFDAIEIIENSFKTSLIREI
jgi:abortive infection bacteriophage resistance protein